MFNPFQYTGATTGLWYWTAPKHGNSKIILKMPIKNASRNVVIQFGVHEGSEKKTNKTYTTNMKTTHAGILKEMLIALSIIYFKH